MRNGHGRDECGGGGRNGHRPAIDPLFRTAAAAFGERATGVILSGNLDDGTAGLREIRRHGGMAIVQDPAEATFRGMPANAIELAGADQILPASHIGDAVAAHVGRRGGRDGLIMANGLKDSVPGDEIRMSRDEREAAVVSEFGCPCCGGVLWEVKEGGSAHYRCRVGHGFSDESLLDAKADQRAAVVRRALLHADRTAGTQQVG